MLTSLFQTFVDLSVSVAFRIKPHYFIEPVVQYMGMYTAALGLFLSQLLPCCGTLTEPEPSIWDDITLKKNRTKHFIFVLWAPHISLSSIDTGELYCFYLSLRLISCCCYLVPALSDVVWWSVAWCDTVLNVGKDILLSLCSTHA